MFETARRYIRLIICYLFKDPVIFPDIVVGIVTDYGSIPMIFLLQSVSTAFGDNPSSCS
jgi:nitrate reductase NapE component